jgi:hypothetical protein
VVTNELKSAKKIIKILHEDRINTDNLKNRKTRDNPPNQTLNDTDRNKKWKLREKM